MVNGSWLMIRKHGREEAIQILQENSKDNSL